MLSLFSSPLLLSSPVHSLLLLLLHSSVHQQEGPLPEPGPVEGSFLLEAPFPATVAETISVAELN